MIRQAGLMLPRKEYKEPLYRLRQNEYCILLMFEGNLGNKPINRYVSLLEVNLCKLLHDLEWWKSCDYSEDTYRRTVTEFKKKWFKQTKIDVQKQIESKFEQTKDELLKEFEYLKGDE